VKELEEMYADEPLCAGKKGVVYDAIPQAPPA
jgi:hypothetical protein